MKKNFIFVLDNATAKAYQLPLSEEWVNNFDFDSEESFECFRMEQGFSDNCSWMISTEPIIIGE